MSQMGAKTEIVAGNEVFPCANQPRKTDQKLIPLSVTTDYFALIPIDLLIILFGSLSPRDLQYAGWVCRKAYKAACAVQINRYTQSFSHSVLWSYLPLIASDIPENNGIAFSNYVLTKTGLTLTDDDLSRVSTLSGLWSTVIHENQNARDWLGCPIDEVNDLQSIAEDLLRYRVNEAQDSPTTAEEFLSFQSRLSKPEWIRFYTVYRDLERHLSILILYFEVSIRMREHKPLDHAVHDQIISSPLFRFVKGPNLVALDSLMPDFLSYFINSALEIRRIGKISDLEKLENMELILYRLSEEDIIDYLSPSKMYCQKAVFFHIFNHNYQLLINKFSIRLIMKLLEPERLSPSSDGASQFPNSRFVNKILSNPYFINKLQDDELVDLLCELDPHYFLELIDGNLPLLSRLTEDVFNQFLNIDPNRSQDFRRTLYLNSTDVRNLQSQNLSKLKLNNRYLAICKQRRPLNNVSWAKLAEITVQYLEKTPSSTKPGHYDSLLLWRATFAHKQRALVVMLKHLHQFENAELIKFSKTCIINSLEFEEFTVLLQTLPPVLKTRAESLSSTQWLEIALLHSDLAQIVAKEYIRYLNDDDLNRLARAYKTDKIVSIAVKRERQVRFEKINIGDKSAEEKALHDVEEAWNGVKMAATHLYSREDLDGNDLSDFDEALNAAYVATQNPSHKNIQKLKTHARAYQSRSSTPWFELGIALIGLAIALAGVITLAFSASSVGFFVAHTVYTTISGITITGVGLATLLYGIDEFIQQLSFSESQKTSEPLACPH